MLEIALIIAAVLLILFLARLGMWLGVFYELTSTLLLGLAMLVTLRYWYPLTRWIASWYPAGSSYAAFGAYWLLFLAGCLPLIVIMNRVTKDSVPKYPKLLDRGLGLVFGALSSAILVCCILTSLSVIVPTVWSAYDPAALPVRLDRVPVRVYQTVERDWLHIPAMNPGHTRFPTFNKADADDLEKYWK